MSSKSLPDCESVPVADWGMIGRRIEPPPFDWLPGQPRPFRNGDYWVVRAHGIWPDIWHAYTPNWLLIGFHAAVEHEDGTITVPYPIRWDSCIPDRRRLWVWNGTLERGVWKVMRADEFYVTSAARVV